ncbi:ren protein from phage origin [Escherichia coli]|nr:ren protein from phage origin [Escherichia coli]
MTGKEAIIHYLGTHKNFCAQDVAAVTGATVTSINQAAAKMARAGILVVDGKVWRTVYYRFATREEREGKMSTNLIFKECRQSAAMKRVSPECRDEASVGDVWARMSDGTGLDLYAVRVLARKFRCSTR